MVSICHLHFLCVASTYTVGVLGGGEVKADGGVWVGVERRKAVVWGLK